jgi:hypothetical protein
MLLNDIVKWYCSISLCVWFLITAYMRLVYIYSDLKFDRILEYLKYTAGLSALIFGLLILGGRSLRWEVFKDRVKWYGLICACVFLTVSLYVQMTWVFQPEIVGRILTHVEFATALGSLVFGLLSIPRWQSFVTLAVWLYSIYRFSLPAFGGGG